jgi:hypothetical protein
MLCAGRPAACPVASPAATGDRLVSLGQRMLEDSVALRFGAARRLVPEFGAWTYGWAQSYLTSYRIIGRALAQLGEAASQPGALPTPEAIAHDLAEPVRAAFREHVTQPSLGDGGFAADMAYLARTLDQEWRSQAGAVAPGDGLEPRLAEALRIDPAAQLADAVGTETVFLRSMRPMTARLGALTLRVSEAGSAVAALGYLGWSMSGAPGVAAGAAAGIGLAWAADWAINRIDAGLNRAAFEAQAMAAIGLAEAAVLAEAGAAIRAAVAAQTLPPGALAACR